MGPLDEVPSLPAAGGLVGVHGPLEVEAQRLVGLAVAVERPHQFRIAERESITGRPVVAPGVPRMPGLAVAVDQLREEGVLGRLRQAGRDELAGEDLVVMGMPVALLVLRQRLKQPFRDDVLDADQVGVLRVAVEQDALDEVLVDLATEVVGLHLHVRLVLGAVQTCDIDVEVLQRRHVLQERRAGLERLAPHRAALSGGRHRARAAADLRVDHAGRPTRVTTARHEASAMTSWRARPGGFAGRAPQRRPPHAQARRDDTHVIELTAAEGTDSTIAGASRGRSARSRGSSPNDRLSAARRGYCARAGYWPATLETYCATALIWAFVRLPLNDGMPPGLPPVMTCRRTVARSGLSWSRFGPTWPFDCAAASVWPRARFCVTPCFPGAGACGVPPPAGLDVAACARVLPLLLFLRPPPQRAASPATMIRATPKRR